MDAEVIDQSLEDGVIDQPAEGESEGDGAEHQDYDDQAKANEQPQDKVDGRKFNPEWSRQLKELRETRPELADMLTKLRDGYARSQAYLELDPKGLDTFKGWKTTIDALGGAEAAASLMQQAAEIEQIDSRIASGDFTVINDLPEDMQKGFYQMLPDALAHMAQTDDRQFGEIMRPHYAAALAATGLGDHMKKMYAAAEGNQALQEMIKQQYDWFQQQTSGKGALPAGQQQKNPEVQRLQQELDRRNQADIDSFANGVADQAHKCLESSFSREMGAYKSLGLNEKQTADLMASVNAQVSSILQNDTAFQNQLTAFKALKNRDLDKVMDYVRFHVEEQTKLILPELVSLRYSGMKAKAQRTPPASAAASNATVRVNQAPSQDQWDMDRMQAEGYENTVKKGIYFLQGNKKVQVARA